MAFDQSTRNRLQKFVSNARAILGEEFTRQLQATYGLDPKQGTVAAIDSLTHLDNRQRQTAHLLRETLAHYLATTPGKGEKDRTKQVLDRIVREQAFTVLNRLAALRMAEARGFLLESIAKAHSSKGFQLYRQLSGTAHGETGDAYRNYLFSLFDEFSLDLAVLFDRHSAQGRLFPRESALLELLAEVNHHEIEHLWAEDETIGWIYQYFNSQEERKKMRAESQVPRNSRELAVRNQFFTPRYVVEFLTDNTLGRIWYEMTQGNTALVDSCRYLVRRPTEIFLKPGETAPVSEASDGEALSQEELLKQPVYIPHRPLKDPRSIRMLDPACGSMHFGLYAFDLFERIYLEAWQLEQQLGPDAFTREAGQQALQNTYDSLEAFKQQIPKLIIEHNIHGVDIDPRAVQIAGLSLWQRAQRAWHQQGIKPQQRPTIVKSNIVCAEPMPGEKALLQEFTSKLNPPVLGQLLEVIFDKMQLAGEAGTLLKIEEEIQTAIHEAREQWLKQSGSNSVGDMFQAELDAATPQAKLGFDLRGIDDATFWDDAEQRILQALSDYADQAESNADQKRLFAEDAAKGFAFIDLCRKRFDVVLMNPPFGSPCDSIKNDLNKYYSKSKKDLAAVFVDRAQQLLMMNGLVGALSTRNIFMLSTYEEWRKHCILHNNNLRIFSDLGYNVLDDAVVEAAAYTISSISDERRGVSSFITCLRSVQKEDTLCKEIANLIAGNVSTNSGSFIPDFLVNVPSSVLAYWISTETIKVLANWIEGESQGLEAKIGMSSADDERFLRLIWEIDATSYGSQFYPLAKGGEWNPFYDDYYLTINWNKSGEEMKTGGATIRNEKYFFKRGLTYPERTTSSFGPRVLPDKCIFTTAGQAIFFQDEASSLTFMGLLLSRIGQILIEIAVGGGDTSVAGTAARHYTNGMVNRLKLPDLSSNEAKSMSNVVKELVVLKASSFESKETSRNFCQKAVSKNQSFHQFILAKKISEIRKIRKVAKLVEELESYSSSVYCINDPSLMSLIDTTLGVPVWQLDRSLNDKKKSEIAELLKISHEGLALRMSEAGLKQRYVTKHCHLIDKKIELICHIVEVNIYVVLDYVKELLAKEYVYDEARVYEHFSFLVGIAFSRWKSLPSETNDFDWSMPSPFSPQQVKSNEESLSAVSVIDADQLSSEIFGLFEAQFGQQSVENIKEKLPDYENLFQRMSLFFDFHLGEYSKSRRQAPIYWPLQTPSGSYTLWVYYHRLNEQTLYTCVNDFIDGPNGKLTQVEQDLNGLRSKSARNSQEEKELEKLSDLASELRDFRDELLRLAKFWKPNLNDGVQITAAPLWKLFQHKAWQKKLKETWEKLEKGDYDWAHLACSIWPERVLHKCHQDRSLAIAHDVEVHFWQEVEVPGKRGKKLTGETKLEWQPKDLTEAELTALVKRLSEQVNL